MWGCNNYNYNYNNYNYNYSSFYIFFKTYIYNSQYNGSSLILCFRSFNADTPNLLKATRRSNRFKSSRLG